jgi:hypothetical protein
LVLESSIVASAEKRNPGEPLLLLSIC